LIIEFLVEFLLEDLLRKPEKEAVGGGNLS
jgi:hypothetical protein